jgi:hypothetical protein
MGTLDNEKKLENAALNDGLNEDELLQVTGGVKNNLRDNAINRHAVDRENRIVRAARSKENANFSKRAKDAD